MIAGIGTDLCAVERIDRCLQRPGFAEHVNEVGAYLRQRLAELPFVTEVRGKGLMCGISLEQPVAGKVVLAGLNHGLVLNNPAANIMRFLPPLVCTKEDVDVLVSALPACYEEALS